MPRPRSTLLALCALLTCSLLLAVAGGDARALDVRKKYERELINWALRKTGLQRESNPEGKIIERVVVVRENIISKSDPWPNLLNVVHIKTREFIIRQELLKKKGDRWVGARIYETERNLRRLFILAVARTVACKSKKPGHVILLVVTKDLWSIRLNIIFSLTGQVLKLIDFTPTEQNFLGRNKQVSAHLRLSQFNFNGGELRDYLALGARYVDPRVFGTRLRMVHSLDVFINGAVPCGGTIGQRTDVWCDERGGGAFAGLQAGASLSRPLFALATPWAFAMSGSIDIRQRRRFTQDAAGNLTLATRDIDGVGVPFVYNGKRIVGQIGFTRRFGDKIKHDIGWGFQGYQVLFESPDSFPFDQATIDEYERTTLPRSETALLFFVGYDIVTTRFTRLRNVNTFALSEDFYLGPAVSIGASFGTNLVRNSASFISLSASASYRWRFGGDLLTVSASAQTRIQPDLDDEPGFSGPLVNNRIELGVKNISPLLWIGRLHTQAVWLWRRQDLNRSFFSLGGDSGLRGYPNDLALGRDLLRFNAEFRSLPINVFTLHLGFVVFYDGGATYGNPFPTNDTVPFVYRQTVGVGLRGHFPQFDRESLRIDLGFPLSRDRGAFGTWFSLSFGQVF